MVLKVSTVNETSNFRYVVSSVFHPPSPDIPVLFTSWYWAKASTPRTDDLYDLYDLYHLYHLFPIHDLDLSGHIIYIYIPDLYDPYDVYDVYDLAHAAGWEPHNLYQYDLRVGPDSLVGSVPHRSCTSHNGRWGSRWSTDIDLDTDLDLDHDLDYLI